MKVSDLMTRQVASVTPDATAFDAARVMWEHDCGFIPVVHSLSRKVLGVVTDRDVCMASFTQGLPPRAIPIDRVMSRSVIHCSPQDDLERVHAKLRNHQVHRLPVVDETGRLVGVISLNDLSRHAVRQGGPASSRERAAVAETLGTVNTPRATALTI
jgi:CBS domain-containing protein